MSQDKQFQQYGYDQFLKAPKKNRVGEASPLWENISEKLRSPVLATVTLLCAGAVFTGIIIMAYPSGKADQAEIPIIKADLSPIKSEPADAGGMDVPFSESTVLSSIDQGKPEDDSSRIENLLAQANEDLTSKEEALQRAMSEGAAGAEDVASERIPQERGMYLQDAENPSIQATNDIIPEPDQAGLEGASQDSLTQTSNDLLQKIDPAAQTEQAQVQAASAVKPKMHAAATSPETIDFVRSALSEANDSQVSAPVQTIAASEEEVSESPAQQDIAAMPQDSEEQEPALKAPAPAVEPSADIEPAAGAASPAVNIERGDYFVQLASITERGRADSEFAKLQKKFSILLGLDYRVQEANLDKGTFFRIQAGPFSKQSAKSICDKIKEQKPGGCILVK